MKLNYETISDEVEAPQGFRRLKFNELVSLGDFVHNGGRELEPWDGPRGFQAGSFEKPIFRRARTHTSVAKKRK